jgi:anti-sigma regulatory factor (Ser/Thr protein kinase)
MVIDEIGMSTSDATPFQGGPGIVHHELLIPAPGLDAPSLARTAIRAWLADESLTGDDWLQDRIVLVTSELVTNAVVHARTRLELRFAADARSAEVGVCDHDLDGCRLVRPAPTTLLADGTVPIGGRGLAIVDAMADDWGIAATHDGKRVWARWSVRR